MLNTKQMILTAALLSLAACGGKQIREIQKENFNLQMTAYTSQTTALAALTGAAMKTCEKDANPGLCADSVVEEFSRGMPKMPQQPVPYQSSAVRILDRTLGLAERGFSAYVALEKDKNILSMLETVGNSAGTHVGGDFINGNQDNSNNSDNSIDNSVAVGGNQGATYGDDFTGGSREETNTEFNGQGPIIVESEDVTVGDQNRNEGNIGQDNRQDSDGAFDNDTDNSNDGDDCEGESCNPPPGG